MTDHDSYPSVARARPPAVVAICMLLLAVTGCSRSNRGGSTHDAGNDLVVTLSDGLVQGVDTGFEHLTDVRKEECAVWGQYTARGSPFSSRE
jgi:hypothetical protein